MRVLGIDDLDPDGVPILIAWDRMRVGDSVFIPCVNTSAARKQLKGVFARRGWQSRVRILDENHIWGLRIWRVT